MKAKGDDIATAIQTGEKQAGPARMQAFTNQIAAANGPGSDVEANRAQTTPETAPTKEEAANMNDQPHETLLGQFRNFIHQFRQGLVK
jgi:hypothetical protein